MNDRLVLDSDRSYPPWSIKSQVELAPLGEGLASTFAAALHFKTKILPTNPHPTRPRKRVPVLIFRDSAEFRAFCERKKINYKDASGTFSGRFGVLVHDNPRRPASSRAQPPAGFNFETLLHELIHSLVWLNFPKCPLWLNEGLAKCFEGLRESDTGQFCARRTNEESTAGRFILGNKLPLLPLSALLAVDSKLLLKPCHWRSVKMKGRPTLLTSRILQGVLGALCRFLHMKGHLIHVYSTLRQAEGKSKASPDAAVSLNIILQSLCGTSEERAGVEFRDWIRQETKEDFGTPSHVMLPLEKDGP